MPKVLNQLEDLIPKNAVYIGRPSKWGNPFKIGERYKENRLRMDRNDVIVLHKDWFINSEQGKKLQEDLHELIGKDLVCFCKPLPCHGDILLEMANKDAKVN